MQLEYAIGVARNNSSENFKNDDDEEDVVDRLNHAGRKERGGFEYSNHREVECRSSNDEQEHSEDDVKDLFDSLDPMSRYE